VLFKRYFNYFENEIFQEAAVLILNNNFYSKQKVEIMKINAISVYYFLFYCDFIVIL